jgi:hypothetical protein
MRANSRRKNASAALAVELLFTLLPFIVYAVIFLIIGTPTKIVQLPGWALAASILFGKTMVRFISVILAKRIPAIAERVVLIVVLLFVLGMVPSLLIGVFMVISNPASSVLILAQVFFFIVAILVFLFFGFDLTSDSH